MDLIKKLYAKTDSPRMNIYGREQKVFSDGELACALDADISAWLQAAPDDLKELMVAYGQSDGRVMFNVLRITVYMSAQKVRAFSPACLCRMAIQASVGD